MNGGRREACTTIELALEKPAQCRDISFGIAYERKDK
jgi:hypothetical protein